MRPGALLIATLVFLAACDTAPLASSDDPKTTSAAAEINDQIGKRPGGGSETMTLCHRSADGSFQKRAVIRPAVAAHLRHGDVLPGHKSLNENCEPVPPPCPCLTSPDLPTYAFTTELPGTLVMNDFAGDETSASLFYAIQRENGDLMSIDARVNESTCAIWGTPQAEPNPYSPPFDLTISITADEAPVCRQDLRAFSEQLDEELPSWKDGYSKQQPAPALAQAVDALQRDITQWRLGMDIDTEHGAPSTVWQSLRAVDIELSK